MEQDYIDKQLDAKIISINNDENIYDVGTVVNVKDFIIEVVGMDNVMFYEKINIANKAIGYVNSINEDFITIAVLKIDNPINVGDMVYSTNTLYKGSYSPSSTGRIIDLFGEDKLSSKKFSDLVEIPIERKTIPIMERSSVNRPLLTGITGIDLIYPIGKGQRQLIIGDKRTGKTQICLDTIVNQQGKNVLCFYVAIGKTKKEVKNIYTELTKRGAISYTTIITAFNDELPPVISLVPYFALSIAEEKMREGYDCLVIIDDLKRHAEAYREISLVSGKTPGRDAYPADIFYAHSRLLEKGCQHKNGGSITILPIVETKGEDITDYISTNIISITDGQIVLSTKNFQKGQKPAINYGLSVSRLGGAVQDKNMKIVGSEVRRKLLSYLETKYIYELVNTDEMSSELRNQFMEGKFILDCLSQYKFSPKTSDEMLKLFDGIIQNYSDDNVINNKSINIDSYANSSSYSSNQTSSEFNSVENTSVDSRVEIPMEFDSNVVSNNNNISESQIPVEVNSLENSFADSNHSGIPGSVESDSLPNNDNQTPSEFNSVENTSVDSSVEIPMKFDSNVVSNNNISESQIPVEVNSLENLFVDSNHSEIPGSVESDSLPNNDNQTPSEFNSVENTSVDSGVEIPMKFDSNVVSNNNISESQIPVEVNSNENTPIIMSIPNENNNIDEELI